ncbi:MAG TPA: hypothetical protein VFG35_08800 [Actinoplanes sp.]|nr:hypothetical protein [Actinoplanes sp.]
MNRVARLLAVTGLALGTAVAIGAVPAQAATGTTQGASNQARPYWDDDETVGYFRSRHTCERVGRLGEIRDRWDDYDCERVRRGHYRDAWRLEVEDWNDGWDSRNWYGGWYGGYDGGDYRGGWNSYFWRY